MPDPAAVNSMFGRIARRYDLANRVLSGGIDIYWRIRLVSAVVRRSNPSSVLDLATGSGDVAFALAGRCPNRRPSSGWTFAPRCSRRPRQRRPRAPGVREREVPPRGRISHFPFEREPGCRDDRLRAAEHGRPRPMPLGDAPRAKARRMAPCP